MDELQAILDDELERLRRVSAAIYGDAFLVKAAHHLHKIGGNDALHAFVEDAKALIQGFPDHDQREDRPGRLAVEELERAAQIADGRDSRLAGWRSDTITDGAPDRSETDTYSNDQNRTPGTGLLPPIGRSDPNAQPGH